MKIIATRDLSKSPIHLMPGDTIRLSHTDEDGTHREVLQHPINQRMVVDVALVVDVEPGELGLETGIGGIFGVKQKT